MTRRSTGVTVLLGLTLLAGILAGSTLAAESEPVVPTSGADRAAMQDKQGSSLTDALTELAPLPDVTAKSWIVFDASSGEQLAAKDATTPRPIASLTKLMTAMLVVERVSKDEKITIPRSVNDIPLDGAIMGAKPGQVWPAEDLVRAVLVQSANDAAVALAEHVTDGNQAAFVELMNERADELGLGGTKFQSVTGLDLAGTPSTSTPVDLVTMLETAMRDPRIRSAMRIEQLKLTPPGGGTPTTFTNRNPLLGRYAGVDGGKTGFTDDAGYMLVVHHTDTATDGDLIVVTAASTTEKTRASDGAALLDWGRQFRSRATIIEGGTPVGSIPVLNSSRRIDVFACDDLELPVRAGQQLRADFVLPKAVKPPISEGDEVGELRIQVGAADTEKASVPLCSADGLQVDGWADRAQLYAGEYQSAWNAGVDEVTSTWKSLTGAAA